MVAAGLTLRVAGEAATLDCETPSDQTTVHGPVPVSTAWIVVEEPAQIAAVPETVAVGGGWTVTTAPPDPAPPAQLASETAVTVYVAVAAGLTLRVAGDARTFDCATPSDQTTVHGPVPVSAAWIGVEEPAQT